MILKLLQDEFDKELQRTQNIDKKAEHFMTIIVLVATIFIPIIPLGNIVEQFLTDNIILKIISIVGFMLFVYAVLDIVYAFKMLYKAYHMSEFKRIEVEQYLKSNQESFSKVEADICNEYVAIISFNKLTNDRKVSNIQRGIKHCAVGILILTLTTLFLKLIF